MLLNLESECIINIFITINNFIILLMLPGHGKIYQCGVNIFNYNLENLFLSPIILNKISRLFNTIKALKIVLETTSVTCLIICVGIVY